MSRGEAAAGPDRLPWLPDEPVVRPARSSRTGAITSMSAAILLVGGAAFWLGVRDVDEMPQPAHVAQKTATIRLPTARRAEPAQPQVSLAPVPEVEPIVAPPQPVIEPPPSVRRMPERTIARPRPAEKTKAVEEAPAPAVARPVRPFALPEPWNPRVSAGASGRLVQIGAFGSVHQSKEGWQYMVRAYPAVAHLPAVVRPSTNSKGRAFYRFQVGTTSQAHSEVLCQRMEKIHLSCAVVGLPWKSKVER